jgi:hypothetical protein
MIFGLLMLVDMCAKYRTDSTVKAGPKSRLSEIGAV